MPAKRIPGKVSNTRNTGIPREVRRVKATFSVDPKIVEKLRGVAWFTRESQSEIVERLISEYVNQTKFKTVSERPPKKF
jgi:hypothetical protein